MSETNIEYLKRLEAEATPGPWEWDASDGGPELTGNVYAPEFNPVLICRGCGGEHGKENEVKGCTPSYGGDPMRGCPLHPSKADRDTIAAARNALPLLLKVAEAVQKWDLASASELLDAEIEMTTALAAFNAAKIGGSNG